MSENRKYFKYNGTIVVIVQAMVAQGGIYWKAVPKALKKINDYPCNDQWKILEAARDNGGGVFFTTPSSESAFRELLDPFIDSDGCLKEEDMKVVHTEKHGDFCVKVVYLHEREDLLNV